MNTTIIARQAVEVKATRFGGGEPQSITLDAETYATVESISYKVDNASGAVWQVLAWQGASALLGPKS